MAHDKNQQLWGATASEIAAVKGLSFKSVRGLSDQMDAMRSSMYAQMMQAAMPPAFFGADLAEGYSYTQKPKQNKLLLLVKL